MPKVKKEEGKNTWVSDHLVLFLPIEEKRWQRQK
jgi:hypothetical protein